jgi:hypothetical protein
VQYERNRRNFNQQAAGSGLNTGTASQAALAQNSTWQRDYGNLRTAEADALTEADRQMAALETQYKSAVTSAIAENDYDRAKALMDEYGNQESRDAAMAKTLASYGDFSGYARLYGDDVANNMAQYWISQNPKLAYDMGRISAEDYARLTGKSSGGSGGGSGSSGGLFGNGSELAKALLGGKTGGTTETSASGRRSETVNTEQYKGLRQTLMQGDDAARKSALDFITRNASKFTDQELSDLANYYMGR